MAGGGGGMGGMGGGGGGGGGMMGGMGDVKKEYTGGNKGRGFVCGESAGAEYGKWIGLVAGTVAGSFFGVPMLGMAGAQVGKSMGSQFDPSVCTPKGDPNNGKRPPMPPGSEGTGGTGADATSAAAEGDSPTKTPDTAGFFNPGGPQGSAGSDLAATQGGAWSDPYDQRKYSLGVGMSPYEDMKTNGGSNYDPYADMAKRMTFGGSNW